jgi:small GTP-binding protein
MLDSNTSALAQDVRELLTRALDALARLGAETEPLRQALLDLDSPFLLVAVGEFNSGKSTLLNALLGSDYLKEGVTPTTDRINLIGFGPEPRLKPHSPELVVMQLPHALLKDVQLVDTPGTNAILRHHQVLTQKFLPRADLILFVTSADRPFTQSEADFLNFIRAWGKKVVLIVNKSDLLTEPELQQVLEFVQKGADQTLGQVPPIFAVSARLARQGDLASSRVPQLEAHIRQVLATQAASLKLGSPLGVLARLAEQALPALETRLNETEQQLATCRELDLLALRHQQRTRQDFQQQTALISQQLDSVQARGHAWLEEKVRISNFFGLLNSSKFKQSFMDEVVKGANAEIEKGVLQALNWLARREHELLEDAIHLLREAPGLQLSVSPGSEAQAIQGSLEAALKEFKPDEEARLLKNHVQEGLQQTALVEFGAVGIGAGLLLVFNRILLDVLGLVTGMIVAVIGFTILPRRREKAKKSLRERLSDLKEKLEAALWQNLELELTRTRERFNNLYRSPCSRLEAQRDKILAHLRQVEQLRSEALKLKQRLG